MDLSGLSSFISAVPGGIRQGQSLQADLATQQEQAKQMRLKTQEMADERAALSALGNAFGLAPPPPPMPQGPQALMNTSTGAPITPPAGSAPPPQPGAPQLQAPPVPPQAQGAPQGQPRPMPPQQQARPPIPPQIQQNLGQMTTEQLAQRIIAANPGIKDRPDLLVRAMAKGQALLAPDAKATVAAMQMEVKVQALQNKLDVAAMNDQTKVQVQNMVDAMRTQIEQLKQAGADQRQTKALEEKVSELEKKIEAKHEDVKATTTVKEDVAKIGAGAKVESAQIGADAKRDAQGVNQQYRGLGQQTAAINKRIQELFAGGRQLSDLKPEEKQLYDGLVKQRDGLAAKAKDLADRAEKAGAGKLPKFSEIVKEEGNKKPEPVKPAEATPATELPKDLPPAAGHAEGSTAKDKDGNVVAIIKNGAWAAP